MWSWGLAAGWRRDYDSTLNKNLNSFSKSSGFTQYNLSLTDNKGTTTLENAQINLENKYDSKYKKDK